MDGLFDLKQIFHWFHLPSFLLIFKCFDFFSIKYSLFNTSLPGLQFVPSVCLGPPIPVYNNYNT